MNDLNSLILTLVRDRINGKKPIIPDGTDLINLYRTCRNLHLCSFLWEAIEPLSDSAVRRAWEEDCNLAFMKDEMQREEWENIAKALSEAGISFMPLKGTVLKTMWPNRSDRYMGDCDFLFRGEDAALKNALLYIGYNARIFGSHDFTPHFLFEKDPWYSLEPHFSLLTKGNPYTFCFDNVWENAEKDGDLPGAYHMSMPDLYLHMLVHLQKHIRHGGSGLRSFLDFVFLLRKAPDLLTNAEVCDKLEKAGLAGFAERVNRVAFLLVNEDGMNEAEDKQLSRLLSGGVYAGSEDGNESLMQTTAGSSKMPRLKIFLHRLFPPFSHMPHKRTYSSFEKVFVYPILWFKRIFRFFRTPSKRKDLGHRLRIIADFKPGRQSDWGSEIAFFKLIDEPTSENVREEKTV